MECSRMRRCDMKRCKMHSQCDDVICCAGAEAEAEADASDDEVDADADADVVGCVQPKSRARLMGMITSGRR